VTDGDRAGGREWWVDEPIKSPVEDGLGRLPFISQLAQLLEQVGASASSTVVGLVGPWGSGKTSTVNLVVAGLDRERWAVAPLNPWALSGPDGVVADLLAAVRAALPTKGTAAARARRALSHYGTFAAPLLSITPLVGTAAKDISQAAVTRLAGESTLQQRMLEVAAELDKLARPVLVVVDDVDRLQPDELLALFKAVRVLGRLPYVHYLLAYDEHTVLDVLRSTPVSAGNDDRALAFLEKVVSLRLDQPPTQSALIERMFGEGLTAVLADVGGAITEDQRRRLADEREALLMPALSEPRGITRFLAQLRAYLPLVGPGEVDLVDFIVLTFLRTSQPRLYRALAAERAVLVSDDGAGPRSDVDAALLTAWRDQTGWGSSASTSETRPGSEQRCIVCSRCSPQTRRSRTSSTVPCVGGIVE
jgi:predicted KAP-like P-loop ATPase